MIIIWSQPLNFQNGTKPSHNNQAHGPTTTATIVHPLMYRSCCYLSSIWLSLLCPRTIATLIFGSNFVGPRAIFL
jgi:hypothetical protein